MIASILMLVGALIWLAGELWGVFTASRKLDTTSEYVWWAQKKWPFVRIVVASLVALLAAHLASR